MLDESELEIREVGVDVEVASIKRGAKISQLALTSVF